MSPHVEVRDVQAWSEKTKLDLGAALDWELESQVSAQVLGRVSQAYDVSGWVDHNTTPTVVRSIISMFYTAWYYDRTYASDSEANVYANKLREMAEAYIVNIIDGSTPIDGATTESGQPTFYPTDASSAQEATADDPSLGGPKFSMGMVW